MPIPGQQPAFVNTKALDIVKAAMLEIGVLPIGQNPPAEESAWVLQKLQRLIDRYNAREPMIWNVNFYRFTPPANKQPITIGAGQDLDVTQRPVSIASAAIILPGNPEVEIPVNIRDQQWWADNRIKGLSSTYATDLYYSPDWPIGNVYLWPIPTQVNDILLQLRLVIAQVTTLQQVISMPPAYWDALVYPLAISLCPSYKKSAAPELIQLKNEALKAIQVNNISSPRLSSDAPQSPGQNAKLRPDFNFLTGGSR